jgi:hypothetical protein
VDINVDLSSLVMEEGLAITDRIFRVSCESPTVIRVHLRQNINKHCHTDRPFDHVHKGTKAIESLWLGFVKIVTEARRDDELSDHRSA